MLSAYFLNTLRLMRLNYENCSLEENLILDVKQHSDYKSLIAKTFDGNTSKMKAGRVIQKIKSKNQCFQLCLDGACTLILSTHFLHARSSAQLKLCARKIGDLERNLFTAVLSIRSTDIQNSTFKIQISCMFDNFVTTLSWLHVNIYQFPYKTILQ